MGKRKICIITREVTSITKGNQKPTSKHYYVKNYCVRVSYSCLSTYTTGGIRSSARLLVVYVRSFLSTEVLGKGLVLIEDLLAISI